MSQFQEKQTGIIVTTFLSFTQKYAYLNNIHL